MGSDVRGLNSRRSYRFSDIYKTRASLDWRLLSEMPALWRATLQYAPPGDWDMNYVCASPGSNTLSRY